MRTKRRGRGRNDEDDTPLPHRPPGGSAGGSLLPEFAIVLSFLLLFIRSVRSVRSVRSFFFHFLLAILLVIFRVQKCTRPTWLTFYLSLEA
jgi:hypothetical protein